MANNTARGSPQEAPVRGRAVTSRYLTASTASSRNRLAETSSNLKQKKAVPKPLSANGSTSKSLRTAYSSSTGEKSVKSLGKSTISATNSLARQTLSTSNSSVKATPSSSSDPRPTPSISAPLSPSRTTDALQLAAQTLPWTYMLTTLESCFQAAESSSRNALESREKDLSIEEADIADQRVRFETERAIAFYEELASDALSQEIPSTFQAYLQHGKECTRITADAIELGKYDLPHNELSIQMQNEVLAKLEQIQAEGRRIEDSFIRLAGAVTDLQSPIPNVITAILAVLHGRTASLSSAEDLVRTLKDNICMKLYVESLSLPN